MKADLDTAMASILAAVEGEVAESLRVKEAFLRECARPLADVCLAIAERLERGGKLLLFGNGGSAADAQHIAAELVGRYLSERRALSALALTTNTSTLTAIANDYGYEETFARQVAALGRPDDAAVGISTSGNSPNVLCGLAAARELQLLTIGFTGAHGGQLRPLCDLCLCVPSTVTARIQECHILAGHILSGHCERVLAAESARAASR